MEELLKLINSLDWTESFYRGAFLILAVVLVVASYHGLKFFGKRSLAILESLQTSVKELQGLFVKQSELSQKQDTRIQLIEQEQKFQNDKLLRHDYRMEELMKQLISTK